MIENEFAVDGEFEGEKIIISIIILHFYIEEDLQRGPSAFACQKQSNSCFNNLTSNLITH